MTTNSKPDDVIDRLEGRKATLVAHGHKLRGRLEQRQHMGFLLRLTQRVLHRQGYAQIGLSAAGVAFWFIIAAFPALIAVIVTLGLFLDPEQLDEVIEQLNDISPGTFGVTILQQVQIAARREPSTLSLSFAVSLALSAWSASSGVYNLSRGIRLAYALPRRNYFVARLRAFAGSFTVILILAVITVTIAAASAWASTQSGWVTWIAYPLVISGALALLLGVMVVLYLYAVGATRPRPRYLPGAILASVGVAGIYVLLGIALRFTTGYQAVYGALAGLVTVMMVLYVSSYIILIGALVNGQWEKARSLHDDGTEETLESSSPA
jgi:membrane protein